MHALVGVFFGLLFSAGILILAGTWPGPEDRTRPQSSDRNSGPLSNPPETASGAQELLEESFSGEDGFYNDEEGETGTPELKISFESNGIPSDIKPGRILKIPASEIRPITDSPSTPDGSMETFTKHKPQESILENQASPDKTDTPTPNP